MGKTIWIFALCSTFLAVAAIFAVSFFFSRDTEYLEEKIETANLEGCITGWAKPTSFGYFVTDIIDYEVVVLYCSELEVDGEQLAKSPDFTPLERVGEPKISEKHLSDGVSKLVLTYTIQAIDVLPGKEYEFPDISVEYFHKDSGEENVYRITGVKPVYISRLTSAEVLRSDEPLRFQPLKPELAQKGAIFRKVLLVMGSIIIALGLVGILYITRRDRPKRREVKLSYGEKILVILEEIELESDTNSRRSLHRLYNLTLELYRNLSVERHKTVENVGRRAENMAYGKSEPSCIAAKKEIAALRDVLLTCQKKGGD